MEIELLMLIGEFLFWLGLLISTPFLFAISRKATKRILAAFFQKRINQR